MSGLDVRSAALGLVAGLALGAGGFLAVQAGSSSDPMAETEVHTGRIAAMDEGSVCLEGRSPESTECFAAPTFMGVDVGDEVTLTVQVDTPLASSAPNEEAGAVRSDVVIGWSTP